MTDTKFDHYAQKKHAHDHGDHDHAHEAHAPVEDGREGPPSEYEIMSRAMQELLEAEGLEIENDGVKNFSELFWDPNLEIQP